MAGTVQCENCGALLLEEDVFCGECGAPRATIPEDPTPSEAAAQSPADPSLPLAGGEVAQIAATESLGDAEAKPASTSVSGWRVAVTALIAFGALACISGILAFLVFGLIGGETTTAAEDWLFATMCCLLPIGGVGAVLVAAGGLVWYLRLRV
jgi:hypothetical protein